jgi:hypothetical protein
MSDKDFISKCKEEMKMNTEIKMMKNGIGDSKTKLPTMEAVIHTIPNRSFPGRNYGMRNDDGTIKRLEDEKLQSLMTTKSSTTGKENIKVDVTKINGKYKINMSEEFNEQTTNGNLTAIQFESSGFNGTVINDYEKIMEEQRLLKKEEKRLRKQRGGAEPFSSTGKTTPPTRLRGQRNSKKAKAQKLARRKNRK